MDVYKDATKKPRKTLSEEARKRKRESNRTRVSLALAFTPWREQKGMKVMSAGLLSVEIVSNNLLAVLCLVLRLLDV